MPRPFKFKYAKYFADCYSQLAEQYDLDDPRIKYQKSVDKTKNSS